MFRGTATATAISRPMPAASWRTHVRHFVCDECGQDLIEYALLTAAVGLAGIATWPTIATSIGTAYRALNRNTQSLWTPPAPGSGP